jgi:hypothetical protein
MRCSVGESSAEGRRTLAWLFAALLAGCSVGAGEGEVNGTLLVVDCFAEGPYVLSPSAFFAAAREDQLSINVQRGGDKDVKSDGLAILVRDASEVKRSWLGTELAIGGETDGGAPVVDVTAYFNETCPSGRTRLPTALKAVSGVIRFDAIYAPRVDANAVRISGELRDVRFAREGDSTSYADFDGTFDFLYQRGRPAQRFP